MSKTRTACACLLAVLSVLGVLGVLGASVSEAMAQQPSASSPGEPPSRDYALDNGDWNGMQDLLVLARAQGVELVVHQRLDYDQMKVDEPWIIVYPQQPLRLASLSRYLVEGGRALLADDFGQSDELLARLDLNRLMPEGGELPHDEFVNQNPALPVFRPRGVHPLLEDVQVVVANHPAVLFNVGGPVIPFSGGGGLVYDMNLGAGKIIVMSDASLFINHMILMADNDKLVRNALRYLCRERSEQCRVHLIVGAFEQRGSFGRDEDTSFLGLSRDLVEDVTSLNEVIARTMRELPTQQLFYYLSILLVAGLAVYLYTIFPMRKTRPYSAYLSDQREAIAHPQSEFDWNLSRFMHGSSSMNYALPVAILKELFEELFLRELELWERPEGVQRPTVTELAALYRTRYLGHLTEAEAARQEHEVIDLLAQLARVPTRHRVFMDTEVYFSERDLLKVHERSLRVLETMGLKEQYDRRTRSHP